MYCLAAEGTGLIVLRLKEEPSLLPYTSNGILRTELPAIVIAFGGFDVNATSVLEGLQLRLDIPGLLYQNWWYILRGQGPDP